MAADLECERAKGTDARVLRDFNQIASRHDNTKNMNDSEVQ